MGRELIAFKDPKSPISEVFRTLRTNIQFMNTKGKLKTLLITSTLPGEGKSWVSSNLAITFAQAGKKVILVDADMRKGRQYSIFGTSPIPGLSNYLTGIDYNTGEETSKDLVDYIQETQVKGLYLIPAGNIPPNPSELLISEQMIMLLEELKSICDLVIIDGLPSLLVADSLILTRIVDSTVIVTASNQTKKDNLKQIINNIKNVGGKIAGIVLNKVPVSAKEFEKSYYYGSTSPEEVTHKNFKKTNDFEKRRAREQKANIDEIKKKTEEYAKLKKEKEEMLNVRKNQGEIVEQMSIENNQEEKSEQIDITNNFNEQQSQLNSDDYINEQKSQLNTENYINEGQNQFNVVNNINENQNKLNTENDSIGIKEQETIENNLKRQISIENIENAKELKMEKTYDILRQVNEYLEKEKKNLKI